MRLLVLDGSKVLFQLVQRLVPADVQVVHSSSFAETLGLVERHEVDALIADLCHADLPWSSLQELCHRQEPRIPVLFQSSIVARVEDSPLGSLGEGNVFVSQPCHAWELKAKLAELLRAPRSRERGRRGVRTHLVAR